MVTDHDNHTNRMGDYMSLISHNDDPLAAAETAFGDLKQFQKALEGYIEQARYKEFQLSSAAAPIDESTYTVRQMTNVEFEARRADVLCYADREAEARALLDSVLKQDPNNVQAHETMGHLEKLAGHQDEARKWYGEAVKLDSKDYLAYYNFASLSMNQAPGDDDKVIEDSLRKAIQLNSRFAPSYDRLAVFYAMRREKLDEAHILILQAVRLDPGEVAFRVNTAEVLIAMERYDDAIAVLRVAEKVAKEPGQMEMIQTQITQLEQIQKARADEEAFNARNREQAAQANDAPGVVTVVANEPPKHPVAPKDGPKHKAVGVIHRVACSYPTVLEFQLDSSGGKTLSLYNNEMSSIELTAAGFTPVGPVNPCTDFEGKKAAVQYVDSSDKTVDGQVLAIELRK
jgi:Tfp pilus assembly protein PilF